MKTHIQAIPAPDSLLKYTHAELYTWTLESLIEAIEEIEETGARVICASGVRNAVPTSYFGASKMRAPHWYYDGETVRAVDAQLETRPRGHSIPANYTITGDTVPPGFRCFKRMDDSILIRRA